MRAGWGSSVCVRVCVCVCVCVCVFAVEAAASLLGSSCVSPEVLQCGDAQHDQREDRAAHGPGDLLQRHTVPCFRQHSADT